MANRTGIVAEGRGRPTIPDEQKRDALITFYLTASQRDKLTEIAKANGLSRSQLIRHLCLSLLREDTTMKENGHVHQGTEEAA